MMRHNVRASIGVALGLLTMALVGLSGPALAGPSSSRTTHETVTVIAIDRATRSVTLQNIDNATKVVQVPSEVKAFDTLKVGDHVDIDYTESMAVSLLPPGSKPTITESSSAMKMGPTGVGGAGREMTVSAEILSIDRINNRVTFRGPKGNTQTTTVSDPAMQKKLATLKPGQVVQLTFTEAVAAAIRPAPMAPAPKPMP
jgi:hypothetical protein